MARIFFLLGVIATIWKYTASETDSNIVETSDGLIKGEELTFEGINYTAFKGIPYAAPPVKNLRFKAPAPPTKWEDVKDCTKYGQVCLQPIRGDSSEDCLTLNVFTPSFTTLKPVLFWIHGGAFAVGDGTDAFYGAQRILQQDIVVVTINYRLGYLGFLATNSSDASGNWALKDQVAALQWVQKNIERFGGDPKKVTIYGESAGSMMVHLHIFSNLSKGLFRSAIGSSGSSLSIVRNATQNDKYSRNLAKILGASESEIMDPTKRIQFLREADPKDIIQRASGTLDEEDTKNPLMDTLPFAITLEDPNEEGAFLTEHPEKLLAQGNFTKVPMMMGVNDLEGGLAFFPTFGKNMTPEARREIGKDACLFLPSPLKEAIIAKNGCSEVSQQIRNVYFDGKSFDDSLLNFIHLWGDLCITKDVHFARKMHAQYATEDSPLYSYYFTFAGRWNLFKNLLSITLPGASHGDDIFYVFIPTGFLTLPELPDTSPEKITSKRMISLISNFVKYGNPTPSLSELLPINWESATEDAPFTMFIGNNLTLEREFLKARMGMWEQVYATYVGSRASFSGPQSSNVMWLIWLPVLVYVWAADSLF